MPINDEFTAIHVKDKSASAPQTVQTNQLFFYNMYADAN